MKKLTLFLTALTILLLLGGMTKAFAVGKIVFTSDRSGNSDIWMMDENGSNLVQLTNTAEGETYPAWSPDGSKIAYVDNTNHNLYIMDNNGTGKTLVYDSPYEIWGVDWSPDGNSLVFAGFSGSHNGDIYTINSDGTNLSQITFTNCTIGRPSFSPSGEEIAYDLRTSCANSYSSEIFKKNLINGSVTQLTNGGSGGESSTRQDSNWQPNPSGLLYLSGHNIWKMDPEIGEASGVQLTFDANWPNPWYGTPAWSPDYSRIVFYSNRSGNNEIWIMNSDGTNITQLTNDTGSDSHPDWIDVADINDGLVAYYPFNGDAADASGNGNNGTEYNGATYTDGIMGQAASFDGVDDYIEVTSNFAGFHNFTLSGWVKIDQNSAGIVMQTASGYISANQTSGTLDARIFANRDGGLSSGAATTYSNIYSVNLDTMRHIVFIGRADNSMDLYVDGMKLNPVSSTIDPGVMADLESTVIGAEIDSNPEYNNGVPTLENPIKGIIDEIRIHNRALSESEIQELYCQGNSLDCDLVAYYPFDGNAKDASGNGNNGTINGATLTTDRFGNSNSALYFDGNDDYVETVQDLHLDDFPITFSAWIKADAGGYVYVSDYWENYNATYYGFALLAEPNGRVTANIGDGGYPDRWYTADSTPRLDVWSFVTAVFTSADDVKIYVNGELQNATEYGRQFSQVVTTGANDRIGGNYNIDRALGQFSGAIDSVSIYNRALSEIEIKELFCEGNNSVDCGLIAHYPFDGSPNDASGNGNNGIESGGVSYVAGVMGQAAYFDGIDDKITVAHSDELNSSDGTWSLWIYPQGDGGYAISKDNYDFDNDVKLSISTDSAHFIMDGNGQYNIAASDPGSLTQNAWHHIAISWGSGGMELFIDGILASSNYGYTGGLATLKELVIGGTFSNWNNPWFDGMIDDIRLYNRILSETEIRELFCEGSSSVDCSLIAHYTFDTDASDATGNGHDGTPYGGVAFDGAAIFDGVDDYIEVTHSSDLNWDYSPRTYSTWIKVGNSLHGDDQKIIEKLDRTGTYRGYYMDIYSVDGTPRFHLRNDSTDTLYYLKSTIPVTDETWHHVLFVYDGAPTNNGKLYVDGQFNVELTASAFPDITNTRPVRIGSTNLQGGSTLHHINGSIDNLRIYNRALSETEIQDLYSLGDSDGDGTPNISDNCPDDPNKIEPGPAGCGNLDTTAPPGTDVIVVPQPSLTITFPEITSGGSITATPTNPSPQAANFKFTKLKGFADFRALDIVFDGTFTGNVTICLSYEDAEVINENNLKLYHNPEGTQIWNDITTSLDTAKNIICGATDSFSPFAVGEPDSDGDGMPDDWENTYGLDPLDPSDATEDTLDNDGLNNLEEYQNSTDPTDSDTDNDGMPDGWEVTYGLDPTVDDASADSDGDGIPNLLEYQNGTDPSQYNFGGGSVTHVPVHNGWWMVLGLLSGLYIYRRQATQA